MLRCHRQTSVFYFDAQVNANYNGIYLQADQDQNEMNVIADPPFPEVNNLLGSNLDNCRLRLNESGRESACGL